MPYSFVEDIATADVAFNAWGKTQEEMFVASSDALVNVMVDNIDNVRPSTTLDVYLKNESLEMLLLDFLQEFIFYKDAKQLILRASGLAINKEQGVFRLIGYLKGEALDTGRHCPRIDVKAVTMHKFKVENVDEEWRSQVVLDI